MASHRRHGPLQVSLAVGGIVVGIYFAYAFLFMGSDLPKAASESGPTHLQVASEEGSTASQQQKEQQPHVSAVTEARREQEIRTRGKAAVLGAFVADAATMPLHWVYDVGQLEKAVGAGGDPAFHDPPSCPFYQYPLGALSPYGDEVLPLLDSLIGSGGWDGKDWLQGTVQYFSEYKGRLNHASTALMGNVKAGKQHPDAGVNDDQAHGLVKVPVLVARYAGFPELRAVVADAVRGHQANDLAVTLGLAAAQLLERVVLGLSTAEQALEWGLAQGNMPEDVRGLLQAVFDNRALDVTAAVTQVFGQSCHLPGSFMAPLHCALVSPDYAAAVRANIKAGGDNCARAHLIGALFAAQDGWDSGAVPDEWKAKAASLPGLEKKVDALLAQRPARR